MGSALRDEFLKCTTFGGRLPLGLIGTVIHFCAWLTKYIVHTLILLLAGLVF